MSRIGKLPVKIPSGVTVTIQDYAVSVKSGSAELTRQLNPEMKVSVKDGAVIVERPSESKLHRSLHGLTRTLVWNMIEGVSKGYEKQLELVGVGYRAARQGDALVVSVGYSHPVRYPVPKGITIDVPEPTRINIKGASKEVVGQVAAEVRKIRPPEPYKGKGILYRGERVRRKAGKTGKTATGATK
ncbi:MAG: 50S ribosomal protein L6 [Chloroflexi bacterium]|nr:MAG: 50S ribosomal protein L6 [Chloroflexota bacterium]TME58291.1 MAG: 50S ribosomal protein L6 [Chloroflexota bacterium]